MRFLIFFLLIFSSVFAAHRLYLSTDFYYQDFKEKFFTKITGKEKTVFRSYQIGYDFEKPQMVYIGADFEQNKDRANEKTHTKHEHVHSNFINYEGRLGYNLMSNPRVFVIPFIGMGDHLWTRKKNPLQFDKIKYHWVYLSYGARFNFGVCSFLQLGFRAKLIQLVKGSVKLYENHQSIFHNLYSDSNSFKIDLKKKLCYELELPLIFTSQTFHPFDLALVPYFQKYILDKSMNSIFLQNSYFTSSKGKTYDVGLRLEIGFNF